MWTKAQKNEFAKQVIRAHFASEALPYLPGKVRIALVHAHCFDIVRLQHKVEVTIEEMDDLVRGVMDAVRGRMGDDFFERS